MNREIKFRAWDDKAKKMVYEFTGYLVSCDYGEFSVGNVDENDDWYTVEVMQYTGLKDKNGKEIYEGDILNFEYPIASKYEDENDFIRLRVVIDFHGGAFWFTGGGYTDCNWHFYNASEREVIGNIYSNPEQLNIT